MRFCEAMVDFAHRPLPGPCSGCLGSCGALIRTQAIDKIGHADIFAAELPASFTCWIPAMRGSGRASPSLTGSSWSFPHDMSINRGVPLHHLQYPLSSAGRRYQHDADRCGRDFLVQLGEPVLAYLQCGIRGFESIMEHFFEFLAQIPHA